MKQELENSLKRFLKRKVKVTLGFMVAFMISGSIGYAESIIPKSEDTEVLLFMNGTFREFDNEKIKNIGEFKLVQGQETIKPPTIPGLDIIKPGEEGGPTTTIPGLDIIKPGEEGGPTTTIPGLDIIKPGEEGGPTTTIPGLDIIKPGEEGGPTTTIPGLDIIKPGEEGGPTTTIPGLDIIKPGEEGGPTTTIPGLDIIKPGEEGGPTTTIPGLDIIKPGEEGGPTTTIPGLDIIKPGEEGGPTTTIPGLDIIKPGEEGGPTTTIPGLDIIKPGEEGGPTTTIPGLDIIKPGEEGGPTTTIPGLDIIKPGEEGGPTTTIPGLDIIKPGEEGGPTTTIPGLDIIKPGEEGGPTTTIPGLDIIKPGEEGGPTTKPQESINTENKVQENKDIFIIKDKEIFTNKGNLTLKSDVEMIDSDKDGVYDKPNKNLAVIKNNGGTVKNEGHIKIEGLKDVNVAGTGHIIKVGEGVGVHQTSGFFENNGTITVAGNGFDGDNDGYIETNGGIGVLIEGGTAINNKTIISPDSYLLPDKGLMLGSGIGMKALDGTIENGKDGLIKNQIISMIAEKKGIAINNGTIETELIGLMALDGGTATNNGTIKAWKSEKEGHIGEAGIGLYASSFNGVETIVTNSETGIVYGSVKAEGTNAKVINNGTIYGTEIKVLNGVIENNGTITGEATKPVIDIQNGKFVQSVNGKLEAEKVNGDIYLSGDYGKNNFEDKISVGELDIKEHNGEVKANSVMYDYNSNDKTLERKEFSDIMANQQFASYLEDNYLDGDIIRQELYNNLKLIDNVKEFNRATNNLFGNDIYPSLKKQTFDMIRFNKNTLVENVFETEANKEWRVIGGADYTNIEANPSNLAGYDTDIKSVFVGADKEINSNHRLGGILNVGTLKSDFDMNNARREDTFVQGNIYSIYNYNGIQFMNNFFLGLSEGELERDLKFGDVYGRQKGDIDTNYLGLNNIVTKQLDFNNSIYLKPKAEFNIAQLQIGNIKENGNYGLVVGKQDVTSIEAGFGIEAGKHFDFNDTLVGTVKVYGNYLAELSDPYKEMEVKLRRIDYSDTVKLSDYDDEDYKDLGIRFELSNESVATYVEYNYTFEDDFFSAGINYRF